jgi:hypothetical protein
VGWGDKKGLARQPTPFTTLLGPSSNLTAPPQTHTQRAQPAGATREDESSFLVIDGLVTEEERASLLAWLTAPSHDHAGPPPADKWERGCVDRAGDAATWGLKEGMIEALRDDPPPAAVALQARVAALYPEWTVAHMPCEALLEDEAEQPLSTHVANAVM